MPPRRRKRMAQPAAPAVRVKRVGNLEQWNRLLQAAGNRVVYVSFIQSNNLVASQMRPYFLNLSKTPKYKRVVFAEVDLTDAQAQEVATAAGVSRLPTYQCWHRGEMKSTFSGGMPAKLTEQLDGAVQEYGSSGGGWMMRILTALVVVGAVAGGAAVWLRRGAGEEEGGPTGETIEEVDLKIDKARGLLRLLEKRHRVKAALSQKKLIERLQRRRKVLERQGAKKRGQDSSAALPAAATFGADVDDWASEKRALQRGKPAPVVYSSEEEE